jgi:hypothetical protein
MCPYALGKIGGHIQCLCGFQRAKSAKSRKHRLAALVGAVMTIVLLPVVTSLVPYLLSISPASFIYIALADLVPGRRVTGGLQSLMWELPLIALGVSTIVALRLT